jgi:hypothetical protein
MVSHVLRGRKNSPKVKNALIGALGCISLEDLIDMRLKECV